jgi:hypothetical protein
MGEASMTRKTARLLTVVVMACAVATVSVADQFGNPEEPALRPYRGMWRGIKAFTYNVVKALNEGNRKFPGLGIVEVGRGVRYGTVELASGTYMGMMGSRPKPVKYYSRPNEILDNDWLLRNTADTLGGAIFWGHWDAETNLAAAAGVFTAQKVVDHSPVLSEREKELYLRETPRYSAQRRYVPDRVREREYNDGDVDFIRRARRQQVYTPGRTAVPTTPPPRPRDIAPPVMPDMAPSTVSPSLPRPMLEELPIRDRDLLPTLPPSPMAPDLPRRAEP